MEIVTTSVLIIGCGPAGMSAAAYFKHVGIEFHLFEAGKPIHERDVASVPEDVICGEGGAGFLNDGKNSWFPAGTAVYVMEHAEEAYQWLRDHLLGVRFPNMPPFPIQAVRSAQVVARLIALPGLKVYPVEYLDIDQRRDFITATVDRFRARAHFGVKAHPKWIGSEDVWEVRVGSTVYRAPTLLECTGRFGPLDMGDRYKMIFRRMEVGVRIEMPMDVRNAALDAAVDPKLTFRTAGGEARTFCYCRSGTVVRTRSAAGLETCSGHSDEPTDRLNHGLNVRLDDYREDDVETFLAECDAGTPYSVWMQRPTSVTGKHVREAVEMFLHNMGIPTDRVCIHAPCVEGVGDYPDLNQYHAVGRGAYVAGDASGMYRGLVPSMLGGVAAAIGIAKKQ